MMSRIPALAIAILTLTALPYRVMAEPGDATRGAPAGQQIPQGHCQTTTFAAGFRSTALTEEPQAG